MTSRSHLWLRISAVALLAAVAMSPRAPRAKAGVTAVELARTGHGSGATRGVAARAETTAARLVSAPRTAKLVVADADESHLTN